MALAPRSSVGRYTVSLDEAPGVRWRTVVDDHREAILKLVRSYIGQFEAEPGDGDFMKSLGKGLLEDLELGGMGGCRAELEWAAGWLGIPLYEMTLLHLAYESVQEEMPDNPCGCTAIVTRMVENNICLARTLDWDLDELKDLVIEVDVTRGGTQLYRCVTWAGYFGVLTAMTDHYAVAINFRADGMDNCPPPGSLPVGFQVRYALEQTTDYAAGLEYLKMAKLMAPAFVILTDGKSRGCVVARGTSGVVALRSLVDIPEGEPEFLVQANMDVGDPEDVMDSVRRCEYVVRRVRHRHKAKKPCTEAFLWDMFQSKPIFDTDTVYTSQMDVASGRMVTRLPSKNNKGESAGLSGRIRAWRDKKCT
eukprot:CAMPEP_0119123896 /NCGR_PEP_ID=MMETSP1310-20130426/3683_1 /TAXON_ID=464262 /ORGANISM="Genus nov. species nov., Strain RCC2339" /LENGTH=363 /DNA_ID=CAMNT_0007113769 /DNA_START=108 /DNA_END=1199 /DNA_ORIENTATION=+